MPFTISDVEKHNKGLTDKEKHTWVSVANSVIERGKDDVAAIKIANSAVKKSKSKDESFGVLSQRTTGSWALGIFNCNESLALAFVDAISEHDCFYTRHLLFKYNNSFSFEKRLFESFEELFEQDNIEFIEELKNNA